MRIGLGLNITQPRGIAGNPLVPASTIAMWDMVTMVDSQTVEDLSGNGYHLQLGPTTGAEVNDPTTNAAGLTFDGVDDYGVAPAGVSLAGLSAFTIIAIAKAQSQSDVRLFAEAATTTTNQLITFGTGSGLGNTDKARLFLRTDAAVNEVTLHSTTAIYNNISYHTVAAGVSATVGEIYIDGALDASVARATSGIYTPDRFAVGALLRATASAYMKMDLAVLGLIGRRLSANEHAAFHAAWKAKLLAERSITLP